jgi:GT2 family glycosyltransferase
MSRTVVILVNYKGARDTEVCLQSLLASYEVPRIVVVDNTPFDGELTDVLTQFPDVHLICAPDNLGFGGGNNLGIEWAMSQTGCAFIFILNNDAAVEPDSIVKLEMALDIHPEAGIVTPRIVFMDKPDVLWYGGGEVSWLRGSAIAPGILGDSNAQLALHEREVHFASGCAMLIRRNLLEHLGGFDARFFMYEEDVELCLRTLELGWKIRYIPAALVLHVVQASSRGEQGFVSSLSALNKNLHFYVFHLVRNRLINMRLHAKGFNRLIFVIGFTLLILNKSLHFARHQRWDGIGAIIRGWRSYRECVKRDLTS